MDAWPELDRYMHQLADLGRMSALLSWDQQVLMPSKGAEGRARAVATLRVIRHRQLTDLAEQVTQGKVLPKGRVLLERDEGGNERTQL